MYKKFEVLIGSFNKKRLRVFNLQESLAISFLLVLAIPFYAEALSANNGALVIVCLSVSAVLLLILALFMQHRYFEKYDEMYKNKYMKIVDENKWMEFENYLSSQYIIAKEAMPEVIKGYIYKFSIYQFIPSVYSVLKTKNMILIKISFWVLVVCTFMYWIMSIIYSRKLCIVNAIKYLQKLKKEKGKKSFGS